MTNVSGPPPCIRDAGESEIWFEKPRLQAGWVGNSSTLWFILLHLAPEREKIIKSTRRLFQVLWKSFSSVGEGKGKGGKGDGTANETSTGSKSANGSCKGRSSRSGLSGLQKRNQRHVKNTGNSTDVFPLTNLGLLMTGVMTNGMMSGLGWLA